MVLTITFHLCIPQVVLTAILWGAGTALGEVPPYLISYSTGTDSKKTLAEIEQVRGDVRGGMLERWAGGAVYIL